MKKFISLSVAIMLLGMGVVFVACQKTSVETAPKTVKNEVKNTMRPIGGFNRTLKGCWPDIYCAPPPGDCYDDVIVYGFIEIQTFESIFTAIDTQDTQGIANTFQEHRNFLIEYMLEQHVDAAIQQSVITEHYYNSGLDTHFLVFKQNNSVIAVYPVKIV